MAAGGDRGRARRLEAEAREAPGRYRLRLLALALLGYGVVAGLLLLALAPFALVGAHLLLHGASLAPQHAYVLILPTVVAALVLRTLWVRFAPLPGHRLAPGEAPELQAEVERLRRAMGAPPLEGIVIDADFNAKAASVPRTLGLFGHRHTLVLGLPLMRVLDRERLAAVIAHEFGHFSAHDGGFAAWIHLSRGTWYRLRDGLGTHDLGLAWLLSRFYGWLAPRFDLDSRALTRAHEYAADAAAAHVVGAQATADALATVELVSRRLDARFWPRLWARARAQAHPPVELHAPLLQAAAGDLDPTRLAAPDAPMPAPDPADTHPTLAQRLQALQATPRPRPDGEPSVAMLGDLAGRLERRLDTAWRDAIRPHWQSLHEAAAPDRARLADLEALATPTPAQLAEHALLAEQVRIEVDPLPLYERALAADPERVLALFRAGLLQLRGGQPDAGAARLRHAVDLDPAATRPALEELRALALDPDLAPAAATAVQALCARFEPLAGPAPAPGDAPADRLLPHDLDAASLRHLEVRLACEPRVARAWIVRRRSALSEAPAHYLVLLDWRGPVAGEASALARLVQSLALPGTRFELFTGASQRRLARQVRAACGTPVYRKGAR